jgi:hypothetical protein
LRVVPEGASQGDLVRQLTWDEWTRQYMEEEEYAPAPRRTADVADDSPGHRAPSGRAAAAYSHVPTTPVPPRRPSGTAQAQRARRRQILLVILGTALVSTLLAFVAGFWLFELLAFAGWIGLVVFLGLMYYAMSLGMIEGAAREKSARLVNPRGAHAARASHSPRHAHASSEYNEFDFAYEDYPTAQFPRVGDDEYAQAL